MHKGSEIERERKLFMKAVGECRGEKQMYFILKIFIFLRIFLNKNEIVSLSPIIQINIHGIIFDAIA